MSAWGRRGQRFNLKRDEEAQKLLAAIARACGSGTPRDADGEESTAASPSSAPAEASREVWPA